MGYIISLTVSIFSIISLFYTNHLDTNTSQPPHQAWEHSIVLDTKNASDLKLLESLKLTQYNCKNISLKSYLECSIRDSQQQSRPTPTPARRPLMTTINKKGDSLKIFANADGSTQMEIFDNTNKLHRYYSFTSTKSLLIYTKVYQSEIFPETLTELPLRTY